MSATTGDQFRKSFLVLISSSIFHTFLSKRFRISGLMLRLLIFLKLSVVQSEKQECSLIFLIFLHVAIQFDQHHLLKCMSFLHCIFWTHYKKKSRSFRNMNLYMSPQFYSMDERICFYAYTMLSCFVF